MSVNGDQTPGQLYDVGISRHDFQMIVLFLYMCYNPDEDAAEIVTCRREVYIGLGSHSKRWDTAKKGLPMLTMMESPRSHRDSRATVV